MKVIAISKFVYKFRGLLQNIFPCICISNSFHMYQVIHTLILLYQMVNLFLHDTIYQELLQSIVALC